MTYQKQIMNHELIKHETKRHVLIKFSLVALIFVTYLVVMSFLHGLENGILISLLTWSFFVFCTPIGDAGFLIDFPMRLFTKIRMVHSEIMVWIIAATLNIYALIFMPGIYEKEILLTLFKQILLNPIPFWGIIILSAGGTFLSIYFGDELMDISKHKDRKKHKTHKNKFLLLIGAFIFLSGILWMYNLLLTQLKITI